MKNILKLGLVAVALITTSVFSEEEAPPKDHPCAKIHAACEAAGYHKGMHKQGKGVHVDCMMPLLEGKSVAGVTVDANELAACKAKHPGNKH